MGLEVVTNSRVWLWHDDGLLSVSDDTGDPCCGLISSSVLDPEC